MRNYPGHGKNLSYYDFGRTTVYACRSDPRFSYCAYVPESYEEDDDRQYRLLVVVHGTGRDFMACRDDFVALAERRQLIIIAPLFPAGIAGPDDLSSYKLLRSGPLRSDLTLLTMVDELRERYRIVDDRFALFGFSGGGHFAHRFFYLHPKRISAVSIGAPGIVTLLDFDYDFWVGVRDFEQAFGRAIALDAMRRIPVQMVVGADDIETWEIAVPHGHALWRPGCELSGANRLDRMRSLRASFEAHGIAVRHDVVPGVAHQRSGLMPMVENFFDGIFAEL